MERKEFLALPGAPAYAELARRIEWSRHTVPTLEDWRGVRLLPHRSLGKMLSGANAFEISDIQADENR